MLRFINTGEQERKVISGTLQPKHRTLCPYNISLNRYITERKVKRHIKKNHYAIICWFHSERLIPALRKSKNKRQTEIQVKLAAGWLCSQLTYWEILFREMNSWALAAEDDDTGVVSRTWRHALWEWQELYVSQRKIRAEGRKKKKELPINLTCPLQKKNCNSNVCQA